VITAVDTNVLLDVLIPESPYASTSQSLLDGCAEEGELILSEAVFAETRAAFPDSRDFARFIRTNALTLVPSAAEALDLAGAASKKFNDRRRRDVQCPDCGTPASVACVACGAAIRLRPRIIADFLIGAHAITHADRLLTRDKLHYRTYFSKLILV
jgi:predicted nucleic acid-binding protein